MKKQVLRSILSLAAAAALAVPLIGQFPAESTIPKSKRGKGRRIEKGPSGAAPRKDGKVDLSGFWGYSGYTSDIAKDYDVGELPMTPLADKLFRERQDSLGKDDPEARCLPTGVPRRDPYPMKILQSNDLVVILFEGNIHSYRQIFMNASHPPDLDPTWYGHSIGKWQGDTLVVDTAGFNGLTWLDMAGHGTSDKLHVIERYSRPDLGTLKLDITIEDPVMYTRPWNVTQIMPLMTKGDIIEYICTENNQDAEHLVGK